MPPTSRQKSASRVDLHRRLGVLGVALVAVMLPLAIMVAIGGISRPLTAPPGIDPLSWSAISLLDVPVLGGLIIAGLLNRHKPQMHKRLMLLAMIDMLRPSLGRILPMLALRPPIPLLLPLLFLLPLIIWDMRVRGRIHPATLWGGLAIVIVTFGTPMIWGTDWWMAFAGELVVVTR